MLITSRAVGVSFSVAASLAFLWAPIGIPSPAHIALKGLAVTMLAVIAMREHQSFLSIALLLSSLGDVLLELGREYFLLGLAAFLTSHLMYSVMFVRRRGSPGDSAAQWYFPALMALYGIGFAFWLTPSLGQLRVPVYAYMVAIVTMVSTASRANYRNRLVLAGAVLFLCSDSLLGTVRFRTQLPGSGVLIWTTYYLGQCGIALGVLSDADANARSPS